MAEEQVKTAPTFQKFETRRGARIFRIPMQAFPFLWVYAYLVLVDDLAVLIDTGSGFGESNAHLAAGFEQASREMGRKIGLSDLNYVFITHGHIDHFGGLAYIREHSQAQAGIHELDLGVLTSYEERVAIAEARLAEYLAEAGTSEEQGESILQMYRLNKPLFHSMPVDFTYEAAGMRVGPFEFLHVPGHCAGEVVIRLDEVLFGGDHLLGRITPHQSPERLTLHTGLRHYLDSLRAAEAWAEGVTMTLAGHDEPIRDLAGRAEAIRLAHERRLERTLEYLQEAHSIAEVSESLFGEVGGYDSLLAIEEAGAHVEYLHQMGMVRIVNVEEIGAGKRWVARYQRVEGEVMKRMRLVGGKGMSDQG